MNTTFVSVLARIISTSLNIFARRWKSILGFEIMRCFYYSASMYLIAFFQVVDLPVHALNEIFVRIIYNGAIITSVANFYIGNNPTNIEVLEKVWRRKWSLFQYYFLVYPSILFILDKINDSRSKDGRYVFQYTPSTVFYRYSPSVFYTTLLHATTRVILIEHKSSFEAVQRSVTLGGRNILLNFISTVFCNGMMEYTGEVIFLRALPNV